MFHSMRYEGKQRRAGYARSGFEVFVFSDTFTSSTMKPGESPRARGRLWKYSSRPRCHKKPIDVDPMRATDDAVMFVTSAGAIIRDARARLRPVAVG